MRAGGRGQPLVRTGGASVKAFVGALAAALVGLVLALGWTAQPPVPFATATAWWVAAAAGVVITASAAPALLGLGVAALVALAWPTAPYAWLAAVVATAWLTRQRAHSRTATTWLLIVPAVALTGGVAAGVAGLGVAVAARLLVPTRGPTRGVATLVNTVIGHATFAGVCLILPLLALLPGSRRLLPAALRVGSRVVLAVPPTTRWRVCTGAPTTEPQVVVSNHGSVLDILAVLALPGRPRILLAKPWVFRAPLLGRAARIGGMLPVAELDQGVPAGLPTAVDLAVFPEGTRQGAGRVGRFRNGAAVAARALGRPVALLAHAGAARVLAPGQAWIRPGVMRAGMFAAPADPGDTPKVWMAAMRTALAERLDAWQCAELGHPLMRWDRAEAAAHRGWRTLMSWGLAEYRGRWRAALVLPDGPVEVHGDPAGVIVCALAQRRPGASPPGPLRAQVILDGRAPSTVPVDQDLIVPATDASRWGAATGRTTQPIPGSDLVLLMLVAPSLSVLAPAQDPAP